MRLRRGFTLLEMLISTVLLALILIGLYGALNMQKRSTTHLFGFLTKALDADRGAVVLYRDIFQSDGNITLVNGEFDRVCLESTSHSLHGLARAKVCWIVVKEGRALLRIEGNDFRIPLRSSDGVEIDEVMKPMALFDIQKNKKSVLVALQQVNRDPYVFLVQGVEPPPKIKKKKKPPNKGGTKGSSRKNPSGKGGTKGQSTGEKKPPEHGGHSNPNTRTNPENPVQPQTPDPRFPGGEPPGEPPTDTPAG